MVVFDKRDKTKEIKSKQEVEEYFTNLRVELSPISLMKVTAQYNKKKYNLIAKNPIKPFLSEDILDNEPSKGLIGLLSDTGLLKAELGIKFQRREFLENLALYQAYNSKMSKLEQSKAIRLMTGVQISNYLFIRVWEDDTSFSLLPDTDNKAIQWLLYLYDTAEKYMSHRNMLLEAKYPWLVSLNKVKEAAYELYSLKTLGKLGYVQQKYFYCFLNRDKTQYLTKIGEEWVGLPKPIEKCSIPVIQERITDLHNLFWFQEVVENMKIVKY